MASNGPTIPVPLLRRDDRRRADRFVAAMPVSVDGREGTTEDLSSTGLSFVADHPYEIGFRMGARLSPETSGAIEVDDGAAAPADAPRQHLRRVD
jgi:hypothetical protein